MLRYVGYLRNKNQLDALFYSQFISIIITSTCFQQAYCSSSGGAYVCIKQLVKKKKLCRLVYRNTHFGGIYCLRLQGISFDCPWDEAGSCSETLVPIYQSTRRCITEEGNCQRRWENLSSRKCKFFFRMSFIFILRSFNDAFYIALCDWVILNWKCVEGMGVYLI